uniref:Cro/CI family transcriptional regulator n=2 Tax=Enterobacteriaceae TaxID=543 RepID=UPI00312C7378
CVSLTFEAKMKKDDVVSYFGSVGNVAKALGISHASVSGWGEVIPKGRAFEIQALTAEKLKVDPTLYAKPNQNAA